MDRLFSKVIWKQHSETLYILPRRAVVSKVVHSVLSNKIAKHLRIKVKIISNQSVRKVYHITYTIK